LLHTGLAAEGFRDHGRRVVVAIAGKIADRHLGVGDRCLDHRFDIAGVHRHASRPPWCIEAAPYHAAVLAQPSASGLIGHPFSHYIPATQGLKLAQLSRIDHDGLIKKVRNPMKLPGPDHPITITANPKRVRVSADGVVIAETTHALTLKEA